MTNTDKLLHYMKGFRTGAKSGCISEIDRQSKDFMNGHKDGRLAVGKAYDKASRYYGVTLSPLRIEPT